MQGLVGTYVQTATEKRDFASAGPIDLGWKVECYDRYTTRH